MGNFSRARMFVSATAFFVLCFGAGCSSTSSGGGESSGPPMRWYAHCDVCKWCKGSYKTSEEAQAVVTSHNKRLHDWYRVAYFNEVKCP